MTRLYTARLSSQVARATLLVGVLMFCFSALAASLFLALAQITRLQTAKDDHTKFMLTMATIQETTGALSDMEVGNRGYLLTGDAKLRETFYRGRDVFSSRYKQLMEETAGESVQQERLKTIKAKLNQWFSLYRPLIQQRQKEVEGSASAGSPSAGSPKTSSTTKSSAENSPGRNSAMGKPAGEQPGRRESMELSYEEQSALVLCDGLFADMRFGLDEIRTFEEKQFYGDP